MAKFLRGCVVMVWNSRARCGGKFDSACCPDDSGENALDEVRMSQKVWCAGVTGEREQRRIRSLYTGIPSLDLEDRKEKETYNS